MGAVTSGPPARRVRVRVRKDAGMTSQSTDTRAVPTVAMTREELKAAREALPSRDVAVVMTMGALHEGHAQLIRAARQRHDHVVVTIFLNPLQFGPKEDLSRYPRTFDDDMAICTAAGVDVVFAPTPDVVYPDGDPGVRISAGPLGEPHDALPGHPAHGARRCCAPGARHRAG